MRWKNSIELLLELIFQCFLLCACHFMLCGKKLGVQKAPVVDVPTWVILSVSPLFHICLNYLYALYFIFLIILFFFLIGCDDIRRIYEGNNFVRWFNGLIQFRCGWRRAKNIPCWYSTFENLKWNQLRALASTLTGIVVALTVCVESLILISFNFFFWRFFISLLLN